MEQKQKRKFNVIDIIAVVLILAVLIYGGYKILGNRGGEVGESNSVKVTYTVKCEDVDKSLYAESQKYIPSQLMASGALLDGTITSVSEGPYYELAGNGEWVQDPNNITLYFTVEAYVPNAEVMTTTLGKQEIRVGKADHILKSEKLEFNNCVILSVDWDADWQDTAASSSSGTQAN